MTNQIAGEWCAAGQAHQHAPCATPDFWIEPVIVTVIAALQSTLGNALVLADISRCLWRKQWVVD
ncbi:hypothetical protein E9531_16000 [Lampropedia puyangensis]|uniref:Uncharacterized protein n=1 Tax=Lampropedia puyangensis TaxID=1330072 RepID=A0A4V4GQ54_9BURK|nr:hypothetical protein [Lampropedia puyangensis]THT96455.1 hypothetical protein E9531_16000 [Lampropedia puyangensis]